MSRIRTESLTRIYGKGEAAVIALDRVNLGVDAGEFVAVMGQVAAANPLCST